MVHQIAPEAVLAAIDEAAEMAGEAGKERRPPSAAGRHGG
jgi:hypothetical protein